jgi:hypothetical protein
MYVQCVSAFLLKLEQSESAVANAAVNMTARVASVSGMCCDAVVQTKRATTASCTTLSSCLDTGLGYVKTQNNADALNAIRPTYKFQPWALIDDVAVCDAIECAKDVGEAIKYKIWRAARAEERRARRVRRVRLHVVAVVRVAGVGGAHDRRRPRGVLLRAVLLLPRARVVLLRRERGQGGRRRKGKVERSDAADDAAVSNVHGAGESATGGSGLPGEEVEPSGVDVDRPEEGRG